VTVTDAKLPCWLPSREAVACVAHHHGYPAENALLRIIRKAKDRPVRARGRTAEGWSVGWSLSPSSGEAAYAIDLDSDDELCLDDMIAAGLLPAPGEPEGPAERAWQPADRAIAYLLTGYLVEWADWTLEMHRERERGEIKLGDLCRDGLSARGQKSLQAPIEPIPHNHFRPEMVEMKVSPVNPLRLPKVVVRVDGTVGVSPRHRQQDYMGPPWCLIEVEWAGLKPLRARAEAEPASTPPTEPPRRPKPHAVGRPPEYPIEIIRLIARDYIEVYGLPQSQAMLREKVRDECERNGYDVPESTRFKELIAPIFKSPPDFSSDEIGR
jgi:hypothetical protein